MAAVLLVGPSWPFRGGIARTTTSLAQSLETHGALERFLVPVRQYGSFFYPGPADIDRDACPKLDSAEACFSVLEPWTWSGATKKVRKSSATAIAIPYWTYAWAPFDLAVMRAAQRPVVGIVHNPADHDAGWIARRAARTVMSRCSGFLCHAESVASTLRHQWPSKPVVVHPLPPPSSPAIDRNEARTQLSVPADAVAFLFFGLVRPYKGLDVLLEAFSHLPRDSRAVLLVAGEAWSGLAREIPEMLARPELQGRVIARLEWIPEEQTASWFAAADVVVLPYRAATGSAVAAQALGHGVPLIGSRVGGIADVVEDGRNGMLVAPSDVAALAAALERTLDATFRARLREGASVAARRWSWSGYGDAVLDLAATAGAESR